MSNHLIMVEDLITALIKLKNANGNIPVSIIHEDGSITPLRDVLMIDLQKTESGEPIESSIALLDNFVFSDLKNIGIDSETFYKGVDENKYTGDDFPINTTDETDE